MFVATKFRVVSTALRRNIGCVRNSGDVWSYRTLPPKSPRWVMNIAEVVGAGAWYWFLWHLWYQPEHIFGHFPYPDPSKWTDAELGIPPDDVE